MTRNATPQKRNYRTPAEKGRVHYTISLPQDVRDKLNEIAAAEHRTLAGQIRWALEREAERASA